MPTAAIFPSGAVRKIPEISAQRAIVAWKDGKETLVISSALDSQSQKLGWIIPIPSVPEKIEKQTPGGLKTLNFCLQPKITHDLAIRIHPAILIAVIGNFLLAVFLFRRQRAVEAVLWVLLLMLFLGLLLPALGSAGSDAARVGRMQVEKSVKVGSYDVDILRPDKQDALNAWLAKNGLAALPAAADTAVADYIARGMGVCGDSIRPRAVRRQCATPDQNDLCGQSGGVSDETYRAGRRLAGV